MSTRWLPPPVGVTSTGLLTGVDGVVNRKDGRVGVGMVARHYLGNILAVCTAVFYGYFFLRATEAMGFRETLVFASNNRCQSIIVEGDSAQVVQALSVCNKSFSDCSAILLDCAHLVSFFSGCKFVFVKTYV